MKADAESQKAFLVSSFRDSVLDKHLECYIIYTSLLIHKGQWKHSVNRKLIFNLSEKVLMVQTTFSQI